MTGGRGRNVVATSFAQDALPVAGGAVILDEVYANPLRRRPPIPPALQANDIADPHAPASPAPATLLTRARSVTPAGRC